jgi:lipoprotein-anchoring transpeptidase ErfK/SrfK
MSYKIIIDSNKQLMQVFFKEHKLREYSISTAKNGLGEEQDSEKTPRGWLRICEKYGDKAPKNGVFIARNFTGEVYNLNLRHKYPERDWILTRILRLEGTELDINKGGNRDTYERFIYIHGTPDDVKLGYPGSRGCIRMRNDDIIELYEMIPLACLVFVH